VHGASINRGLVRVRGCLRDRRTRAVVGLIGEDDDAGTFCHLSGAFLSVEPSVGSPDDDDDLGCRKAADADAVEAVDVATEE
jgi:hypothetical protein